VNGLWRDHKGRSDVNGVGEPPVPSPPSREDAKQTYFCRGCGCRLQRGFRGHFHKECLRADKRRRVQAQRRREQERFEALLQRQHCHKCGARYDTVRSERVAEASCEASRLTQGGD
jgi:hypothetical protein